jgi:hypothetical protein
MLSNCCGRDQKLVGTATQLVLLVGPIPSLIGQRSRSVTMTKQTTSTSPGIMHHGVMAKQNVRPLTLSSRPPTACTTHLIQAWAKKITNHKSPMLKSHEHVQTITNSIETTKPTNLNSCIIPNLPTGNHNPPQP